MGIECLSASTVSMMANELDEKISEFLKKPIESPIPYIFIDASYFKVRDGGKYVTKAFLIIMRILDNGHREILGGKTTDNKREVF
jgi:putative transposase